MWLSEEIATSGKENFEPKLGYITRVNKNRVTVKADTDYSDIKLMSDSTIKSAPRVGDEAIVFPIGDSAVCSVLSSEAGDTKDDEICISNNAGAYILLKSDGTIIINGQTFKKEE